MSQLPAEAVNVIDRPGQRRGKGWLLLVPGMLWLLVFFLFPTVQLFFTSLYDPSGSFEQGYAMTWHFQNYVDAVKETSDLFVRSFLYAGITTGGLPSPGLPTGVRHRLQVRPVEERHAGACHRPVLHQLLVAHLVVAGDPR
ncbi:MAG: hypothetical protein WKF82_09800 [Nocardioidaceae bacterium]